MGCPASTRASWATEGTKMPEQAALTKETLPSVLTMGGATGATGASHMPR